MPYEWKKSHSACSPDEELQAINNCLEKEKYSLCECPNWLSNPKWSSLKAYMQATLTRLHKLCVCVCVGGGWLVGWLI